MNPQALADPPHSPSQNPTRPEPGAGERPAAEAAEVALDELTPTPPEAGFGQLWQKRYRVRLDGITIVPEQVITTWREHYGELWPEGNRFSRSLIDAQPGDLAVSDLQMPAGARLFAGVIVAEIHPTSFSFVTTPGHTFAALITFSAMEEGAVTVAQIEILLRASDPLYEIGLMFGGHLWEDEFWKGTLKNLATHLGAKGEPTVTATVLDRRRLWGNAGNVIHNGFIHSMVALVKRPFQFVTGRAAGRKKDA
jgi:hypothetical protein